MGSRYVVGRIPLYLVLIGSLLLAGCLLETWEGLVQDEYTSSRADRICHPYGDCEQGEWVRIGKSESDTFLAYLESMRTVIKALPHVSHLRKIL